MLPGRGSAGLLPRMGARACAGNPRRPPSVSAAQELDRVGDDGPVRPRTTARPAEVGSCFLAGGSGEGRDSTSVMREFRSAPTCGFRLALPRGGADRGDGARRDGDPSAVGRNPVLPAGGARRPPRGGGMGEGGRGGRRAGGGAGPPPPGGG